MSTPHIEHFVDERGNFIYRAEFEGSFLSKDEAKELAKYVSGVLGENHRLRDELSKWERLTAGIDLPEYPVTQFKPKDLERENAKLRELVRHLYTCMERQEPDGSLLCANCPYENESNECDYEQRMEELGVEL